MILQKFRKVMWGLPFLALALAMVSVQVVQAEKLEIFYDDKVLKARINTRLGEDGLPLRHGYFEKFHPNGKLALSGVYKNGQPIGYWEWWSKKGRLIRRVRMDGKFEEVVFGQNLDEMSTSYKNIAGKTIAEGIIKSNQGHGDWQYWYDDGSPKAQGKFLSGIPEGKWKIFYPNGQIKQIMEYKLGIYHGLFLKAYPTGQESEKGPMVHGLKDGLWSYWYPNGQKEREGEYRQDLKEGIWRFWDETGKFTKKLLYEEDLLTKEFYPIEHKKSRSVIPNADQYFDRPLLFDEEGNIIRFQEKE